MLNEHTNTKVTVKHNNAPIEQREIEYKMSKYSLIAFVVNCNLFKQLRWTVFCVVSCAFK